MNVTLHLMCLSGGMNGFIFMFPFTYPAIPT